MLRWIFCAALVVATAATAGAQPANKPDLAEAAALYRAAEQAMAERRYDDAARDYGAAYEISKDAVLFFKIGSALDKGGKCPVAVTYYRRYLREGKPNAEHQKLTNERIATCEKTDGKPAEVKPDAKPEVKPDAKPEAKPDDKAKPDAGKTPAKPAKPASGSEVAAIPNGTAGATTPSATPAPASPSTETPATPATDPNTTTPASPTGSGGATSSDGATTSDATISDAASAETAEPTGEVAAAAAESEAAELAAAQTAAAEAAAAGDPNAEVFPAPPWRRTAAWVSVGTGIAFVTIGAVMALSAESTEDDITDLYIVRLGDEPLTFNGSTERRYDQMVERGERYQTLAWASFGVAAAAAAAATYFFLTSPSSAEAAEVEPAKPAIALRPILSKDGGGVGASWSF